MGKDFLGKFFKNVTSTLRHIIRHVNAFLNPKYQWHRLNKSYLIHFYSISHNLKNLYTEIFYLYSSNIRDGITWIWSVEYRVCWKCTSENPSSQPLSPLPWTAVSGYRITFLRNIVDSLREISLTLLGSCDTTVPTFDKFPIANSHDCWDVAILIFRQQSYLHFARAICTCTLRQRSVDITVYLFRADLKLRISV